jgi:AraC-like DNA-binding protein
MERAGVLLLTYEYKIKEVAQMVAYPNQLHFSNAFHKYYGVSPLQYAKSKGAKK